MGSCDNVETPIASTQSTEEAISEAVELHLSEQGGLLKKFVINLEQLDGNFARVQIVSTDPAEPGGFSGFLQRVDGNWMVVRAGPDLLAEDLQAAGIPESILPEGWVFSSDKSPELTTADGCLKPIAETQSWVDETLDFCLLYPASHMVIQPDSGNTEIVIGEVMNHIDPRISIIGEDLAGRTLEQVMEEFLSGYAGFEIDRRNLTVDKQNAVLLDNVPGQDFYRKVFIGHNGLVYQLNFTPYDSALDNIAQAEELYMLAIGSFRFMTP